MQKGHLKFELDGEKLKGGWALIRTHGSKYGGKIGRAGVAADQGERRVRAGRRRGPIVDEEPDSVVSGRSLDEIARDKANEWHSNRSVAANVRGGALADVDSAKSRKAAKPSTGKASRSVSAGGANGKNKAAQLSPASAAGAKKARMPASLSPTLATLVDSAPTGDDWIHEVKFDGYRMVSRIDHGDVRIYSRNGKDWTAALPSVVAALQRLDVDQAWLDGEVAVADAQGLTSFQQLQNALSDPRAKNISYFVFDLLYLDGYDLRGVALTERKQLLRALVGKVRCRSALQRRRARLGRRILRAGLHIEARRRGLQARRFGVSRRRAHARLGEGQVRPAPGNGDRRLHRPAGKPHRLRRAAAGHLRRRQAPLCRQGRHRIRRQDADQAAAASSASSSRRKRRSSTRRAASKPRARTGSSRSWSPKSRSPSGAMTERCAIRRSRACARTRKRPTSCASRRRRSRRATATPSRLRASESTATRATAARASSTRATSARATSRRQDRGSVGSLDRHRRRHQALASRQAAISPRRSSSSATSRCTTRPSPTGSCRTRATGR